MRATAVKGSHPLQGEAPPGSLPMFALPRPFRTPESPSSDLSSTRSGARAGATRTPPEGGEVTRRVSLPAGLDRAIEAMREVTGASRDESIAALLRSGLRGTDEGAGEPPPWAAAIVSALEAFGPRDAATTPGALLAPPDMDELSAAATRLAEIAERHRTWLGEHQAALDETYRATGSAVADLREFAHRTEEVRLGLSAVLAAVEGTAERQRATLAKALSEATTQAKEQLALASAQVAAAQEQMREFEEARAVHLEGLKGHVERYRRALRLTPTLAVSFVGVACVIAVVTSIVFVPSFQKFSEDEFVQRQIAPVIREEVKKSFEVLRAENDKTTQDFFALEQERFEKFAAHYRKQIASLKGDKAAMADENQRLSRAFNEQLSVNAAWKKHAADLQKENDKYTKSYLQRACGSIGSTGAGSSSLALLLAPLVLIFLVRSSRRRLT